MAVDIGVTVLDMEKIGSFGRFAHKIGYTGIAVAGLMGQPYKHLTEGIIIYRRDNLTGKGINSLRNQIERVRKSTAIIAVQVGPIDTTNWAAEDRRVDILTLDPSKDHKLRSTTASLASSSSTTLELQVAPLLCLSGLQRSRVLKAYREAVMIAISEEMEIILSSGATYLMGLRSPVAMMHIGMLLGLDRTQAERAVHETPTKIMERSTRRLGSDFISPGVEVVRRGENT
jgi:RNase P/RNase MRP subunit p30